MLRDEQKELLMERLLAELDLENISYVRIGGYNARPRSAKLGLIESIRTQSIKGVWRRWARALLGGAYISNGWEPPSSIKKLDEKLNNLMGSIERPSKISIKVDIIEANPWILGERLPHELRNIPRLKLLTMKRREKETEKEIEECLYRKLRFTLRIFEHEKLNPTERHFLVSSLIVALSFGGIGSITTRGFGKFMIKSIKGREKKEFEDLNETLREIYHEKNRNMLAKKLKKLLFDNALRTAKEYVRSIGDFRKRLNEEYIPSYPIIVDNASIFRLDVPASFNNLERALECIGKSVMKVAWKRNWREDGKRYHTWVLGMPRGQMLPYEEDGKKVKKKTGYYIKVRNNLQEGRLRSPISFTLIRSHDHLYHVVVYGFVTRDLALLLERKSNSDIKQLVHVSIYCTKPSIKRVVGKYKKRNETKVLNDLKLAFRIPPHADRFYCAQKAYDHAWERVINHLKRCQGGGNVGF